MANLDWPAFGEALWLVNDQLGIPPEWQLAVMYLESGLDPSSVNAGGCSGLNQLCAGTYEKYVSVPVSVYRTWAASTQLSGPVLAYWRDALAHGPINSPARLMLAQLGSSKLGDSTPPNYVVFARPSPGYTANCWLDLSCRESETLCLGSDLQGLHHDARSVRRSRAESTRPGGSECARTRVRDAR